MTPQELALQQATAGAFDDPEAATRGPAASPSDLAAEKEKGFQDWYGGLSKKMGWTASADDPEQFYDYRALHRDVLAGKAIDPDKHHGHFPSEYKTAGHPRTYLTDQTTGKLFDTRTGQYLAGGDVPQAAMNASELAPDRPEIANMTPEQIKALALAFATAGRR